MLKKIEKILAPVSTGHLVFRDSIYIATLRDLSGIMYVYEVGDIKPGTKLYITKRLYECLNKPEEEIEKIIKEKYDRYKKTHRSDRVL